MSSSKFDIVVYGATGFTGQLVAEYLAAHEITIALERGADDITAGDIGAAIEGYRALFDHLVANRGSTDADFAGADEG